MTFRGGPSFPEDRGGKGEGGAWMERRRVSHIRHDDTE